MRSRSAGKIANSAEFREKYLNNLGFEPVGDTPDQFSAFLITDRELAASGEGRYRRQVALYAAAIARATETSVVAYLMRI